MDETRTTGSQAKNIAAVLSTVFWCLFAHGYRFATISRLPLRMHPFYLGWISLRAHCF